MEVTPSTAGLNNTQRCLELPAPEVQNVNTSWWEQSFRHCAWSTEYGRRYQEAGTELPPLLQKHRVV